MNRYLFMLLCNATRTDWKHNFQLRFFIFLKFISRTLAILDWNLWQVFPDMFQELQVFISILCEIFLSLICDVSRFTNLISYEWQIHLLSTISYWYPVQYMQLLGQFGFKLHTFSICLCLIIFLDRNRETCKCLDLTYVDHNKHLQQSMYSSSYKDQNFILLFFRTSIQHVLCLG